MTNPIPTATLLELIELGARAKREGVRLISDERDFEIMSARLSVPLALEVRRLRGVLRKIAHAPEYDGSLCPDPEDCPNCIAKEALRAQ